MDAAIRAHALLLAGVELRGDVTHEPRNPFTGEWIHAAGAADIKHIAKDLEKAAVDRQAEIDGKRQVAELVADVHELIGNEADPAVIRRTLAALSRRTGVDSGPLQDLADTPDALAAAANALAGAAGLTRIGDVYPAGAVPYDRKIHKAIGKQPPDGRPVEVIRPGYSATLNSGEVVQLDKATVEDPDPQAARSTHSRTLALLGVVRAAGHDVTPGDDQLHHYWTRDPEGLAQWADSPHPWTTLYGLLLPHLDGDTEKAKRITSAWYIDVFHHTPNQVGRRYLEKQHPRDPHNGEWIDTTPGGAFHDMPLESLHLDTLLDTFARLSAAPTLSPTDEAKLRALDAELARREAGDKAPEHVDVSSVTHDAPANRKIDELLMKGLDYRAAYAEAYDVSPEEMDRKDLASMLDAQRWPGETRDKTVKRLYAEVTALSYLRAEAHTRGNVLSAAGIAAGIDPISLFSGPRARARKYASEELKRYWQDVEPRQTYTEFRAMMLGRPSDIAAANKIKSGGHEKDFGL
jgi:hypothetical protein